MLKAFAVYSSLILVSFAVAGFEGYSVGSLFADSKHMGPGGGGAHVHSYYSGHYHK